VARFQESSGTVRLISKIRNRILDTPKNLGAHRLRTAIDDVGYGTDRHSGAGSDV
jgi:hypothetical protein